MTKIVSVLDCGCAIHEDGTHTLGPTCESGHLARDTGLACWKALNRLLRECEWSKYIGGGDKCRAVYPADDGNNTITEILAEAEAAHSAWVHAHGEESK